MERKYVLVSCVSYYKPDIVPFRECNAIGDIGRLRDIDGVVVVVPQCARTRSRGERVAALV